MNAREFATIAFRLLAGWLFLHAIYYSVGGVLWGLTTFASHGARDWSRYLAPFGLFINSAVLLTLASRFWRTLKPVARVPIVAPLDGAATSSNLAHDKLAPLLTFSLAAWGALHLIPAIQAIFAYLVYTAPDWDIPLSQTLNTPSVHRRLAFEVPRLFATLTATLAPGPFVDLMLSAKRRFARQVQQPTPGLGDS